MKFSVCNCGLKKPWINFEVDKKQASKSRKKCFSAFTLAEMMVVMLIMSIILAAMAPVMTTRAGKSDNSSPWRYSPENLSDAYFGPGDSHIAMIGQPNKLETDDAAKLIINSSDTLKNQISFKRNNATVGHLLLDNDKNVILGNADLGANTGNRLSSFGIDSLQRNTTGNDNTAIGAESLMYNTTGNDNTAVGQGSLMNNISGSGNNALGTSSLRNNTSGSSNTAVGQDSLYKNNGSNNTAIGWYSLNTNEAGSNDTALGSEALYNLSLGNNHVAIGYQSLRAFKGANTTDSGNTAVGTYSMLNTETGDFNTSLGYDSLRDNNGGNYNVAIGYRSNYYEDGVRNISNTVAVGSYARTTANNAIAIGDSARALGESSTALGDESYANENNSIAIGKGARVARNGYYSAFSDGIAIGTNAKVEGTSCERGTCSYTAGIAIGQDAYTLSSDAVVIGYSTYANSGSVAIGGDASTERHSVAIGYNAKVLDSSVAIGYGACKNVTGNDVICIGNGSGPAYNMDASASHMVYLGSSSDTVYIPGNLVVDGHVILGVDRASYVFARIANQKAQINQSTQSRMSLLKSEDWKGDDDNACAYTPSHLATSARSFLKTYIGSSWQETKSDRRLKYVGKENKSGLDKIRQLKVFNFTFKKDENKTPHVGVIAQDLQKIFPDAVRKGADGFLSIRMEDMFFAMVNAIKELDLKYQAQEKRIDDLEKRIQKLEAKVK